MQHIFKELTEAVVEGDVERLTSTIKEAIKNDVAPTHLMMKGMVPGMLIIGERFARNEIFLPEMLFAARAMNAGLGIVEPLLINSGDDDQRVKVVLGTVKGDMHDVGKNMVRIMFRGAGFKVIDLGVDVFPERFLEATIKHKAPLVGLSALLTSTLPAMESTITAFEEAGIRKQCKILVGGAPVSEEFADRINADGYAPDCATAVIKAKKLLAFS